MKQPDYQRVRELFQKAVTLSDQDQKKYLDEACVDDPLHRQAVEELLQHHSTDPLLMSEHDSRKTTTNWETASQLKSPTLLESQHKQRLVSRITRQFRTERRLVWLMAPLAAILLSVLAVWVQRATHDAVRSSMQEKIQAMLEQQVFALSQVLRTETELVNSWARSPELCTEVAKLSEEAENAKDLNDQLASSPAGLQLRHIVQQLSGQDIEIRYSVWSRDGVLIASSGEQSKCLGNLITPYGGSILSRAFAGEVVLSLLTADRHITKGVVPPLEKKPKLAIFVPVYAVGDSSRTIGCLAVTDNGSQNRFEDLFQAAQFGESAEFYAIDRRGYLITESRFPDQLRSAGLIADDPNSFTGSVVRVADPGGDITAGFQPKGELLEMPLTHAAAAAVAGHSGQNYEGFNDYRGVEVVGAWDWLDDFGFGVIGKMDRSEAFESLRPLQQAYGLLIALLGLSLLGWIAASMALVRARQAAGIAAQIGPYKINKKIGEGGLGQVFLATHTLLKRPTALKLLKPEEVNAKNERRFEREIHIASSLMHRNTIEIYDYGKTRDGGFYSAMEYIDGLTLNQMVDLDGPQRPERVVRILGEVCGSLKEAHARGLIHRDIKPQNIMLCCQGGEPDSVKVLDFGLARDIEQNQWRVTDTQMLVGTPMYIAPERIVDSTCIDPRSDIFSLGVVAYFLLTGQEPFDAKDAIEALSSTLQQEPPSVSKNSPWSIPEKLELLVNQCQAKKIEDRVRSIEDLLRLLAEVNCKQQWTNENASRWWWHHAPEKAERSNVSRIEE